MHKLSSHKPANSYQIFSRLLNGSADESESMPGQLVSRGLSAAQDAAYATTDDPEQQHRLIAELVQGVRELAIETGQLGDNVMSSPQNQVAALLQSVLEERVKSIHPDKADLEFPFDKHDVRDVLRDVFVRQLGGRTILRNGHPHSNRSLWTDSARLFIVGDFGTGMYGAVVTAATITEDPEPFFLLLHLGDIYYSGQPDEVKNRFLEVWPKRNDEMSRTLNGNDDMYSGGYGYFDVALRSFKQPSSYFAMQNEHWTLLFLDTAYKDNDLDAEQVQWIERIFSSSGDRKVILFSHHPLFSNFKNPGVQLAAKLHSLLRSRRIAAWYWAHEHHCVIYEPHPLYGFKARCIGNGGMPAKRKKLADFPVDREIDECFWLRIEADLTPSCLILDGPNPYIPEKPNKYLPHGYATLQFDGDRLLEVIHLADGRVLYSSEIS